jgi:hypothetical protein
MTEAERKEWADRVARKNSGPPLRRYTATVNGERVHFFSTTPGDKDAALSAYVYYGGQGDGEDIRGIRLAPEKKEGGRFPGGNAMSAKPTANRQRAETARGLPAAKGPAFTDGEDWRP